MPFGDVRFNLGGSLFHLEEFHEFGHVVDDSVLVESFCEEFPGFFAVEPFACSEYVLGFSLANFRERLIESSVSDCPVFASPLVRRFAFHFVSFNCREVVDLILGRIWDR